MLFDAVVLLSGEGAPALAREAAARSFVADAFAHLEAIGHTEEAATLLAAAGVPLAADAGVLALDGTSAAPLVEAAQAGRIWSREPAVRQVH